MDRCISVHIDIKGREFVSEQNPNHFDVAFVTGPMQWSVFADFLSIFGLFERIVISILIDVFVLAFTVLGDVYVLGVSVSFD